MNGGPDFRGTPQLYAVYLGGDPAPGRLSEDHEVVLVVAGDVAEARQRARAKWGGDHAIADHVDGVRLVDVVDGFAVAPRPHRSQRRPTEVDLTYLSPTRTSPPTPGDFGARLRRRTSAVRLRRSDFLGA